MSKFYIHVIGQAEVNANNETEAKRLIYKKLVKDNTLFQFVLEEDKERNQREQLSNTIDPQIAELIRIRNS